MTAVRTPSLTLPSALPRRGPRRQSWALLLAAALAAGASAFVVPRHSPPVLRDRRPAAAAAAESRRPTSTTSLSFFPRANKGSGNPDDSANNDDDNNSSSSSPGGDTATAETPDSVGEERSRGLSKTGGGFLPFFARPFGRGADDSNASAAAGPSSAEGRTAAATAVAQPPPSPAATPEEEARRLRSEAERIRLEAERMDAELTLQKIAKLERQLLQAQRSTSDKHKPSSQEDLEALQLQLQVLQTKLLGGGTNDGTSGNNGTAASTNNNRGRQSAPPSSAPSPSLKASSSASIASSEGVSSELKAVLLRQQETYMEDLAETAELLRKSPALIKKILAASVDLDYDTPDTLNVTELALRLEGLQVVQDKPAPTFTAAQIREREQQLKDDPEAWETVLPYLEDGDAPNAANVNMTRVAILSLEYDYYFEGEEDLETLMDRVSTNLKAKLSGEDEQWLVEVLNRTAADATVESLYPKCMRRGPEPTLAQVQQLVSDIRGVFPTTQQPEKVLGGYVLRGAARGTAAGNADQLVAEIDAVLARKYPDGNAPLSVFYTQDFSIFLDPDAFETFDPDDVPPILYVTGPDVVPPSRRVALTAASAAGLATCWYLAIYPFLLNPAIAKRVEDQLALADAGMTPDLNWLSDLSLPLFFAFVGIQIAGEVGHQVVASANKVKLSVPTFVPSLITGITSTVTTFKTPPPNKTALFDIALAGPLVSITASLLAIIIGSSLTLTSDPSTLPALPLEILRQSTLGGGIINGILGNGVLSIPEGAQGTAAVAGITIPLHPVAVAGYIALIVNALSLLPIGTTDGGRIALAVFGRGAKLLIGNIFLLALLFVGFLGSDLFLFYFGFLVLFQTGNEIAARNEVDKIEFSRVAMAIAANVLMLLTLIPFQ